MENKLVVHKKHLALGAEYTEIEAASNAFKVIHVDEQDGRPTIWFETATNAPSKSKMKFTIVGTGHDVPEKSSHVGSCKCGAFVWHIYQMRNGT